LREEWTNPFATEKLEGPEDVIVPCARVDGPAAPLCASNSARQSCQPVSAYPSETHLNLFRACKSGDVKIIEDILSSASEDLINSQNIGTVQYFSTVV
jgi:hypothetical protein